MPPLRRRRQSTKSIQTDEIFLDAVSNMGPLELYRNSQSPPRYSRPNDSDSETVSDCAEMPSQPDATVCSEVLPEDPANLFDNDDENDVELRMHIDSIVLTNLFEDFARSTKNVLRYVVPHSNEREAMFLEFCKQMKSIENLDGPVFMEIVSRMTTEEPFEDRPEIKPSHRNFRYRVIEEVALMCKGSSVAWTTIRRVKFVKELPRDAVPDRFWIMDVEDLVSILRVLCDQKRTILFLSEEAREVAIHQLLVRESMAEVIYGLPPLTSLRQVFPFDGCPYHRLLGHLTGPCAERNVRGAYEIFHVSTNLCII